MIGVLEKGPSDGHGSLVKPEAMDHPHVRKLGDCLMLFGRERRYFMIPSDFCVEMYDMQIHTHVCAIPPVTVAHDSLRYMPKSGAA